VSRGDIVGWNKLVQQKTPLTWTICGFNGAYLRGICLAGASLKGAEFIGCDLRNADFTDAEHSPMQL